MPQEALILAATPRNNSAPGNPSDEAGISSPFPPPLQKGRQSRVGPYNPVPRLIEIAIALFTGDESKSGVSVPGCPLYRINVFAVIFRLLKKIILNSLECNNVRE